MSLLTNRFATADVALALNHLHPEEREELFRLLQIESKIWKPNLGPQTQALDSQADIILYGGAAGGGKSDLMLGLAIQHHHRSIIFRREMTQAKALIDRAKVIVGDAGKGYNSKDYRYKLPSKDDLPPDRFLEFGSVPNPGDEDKFQGRPHDFIGFDEGAHFSEYLIRFLSGWNRSEHPVRCRIVIASNPPMDADGDWMFSFFAPWLDENYPAAKRAMPGELRWFARHPSEERDVEVDDGTPFVWERLGDDFTGEKIFDFDPAVEKDTDIIQPRSRTFIPAKVSDNPHYAGSAYMSTLQSLPEPMRSKMLLGLFTTRTEDANYQVIPTAWVKKAMDRWKDRADKGELSAMGVDVAHGGKDKTVISKRYENWFDRLVSVPGKDTPDGETAARLVLSHSEPDCLINVDIIGWGSGCVTALKMMGTDNVTGVIGSERSDETDRSGRFHFKNKRSEMYWKLREALDPEHGDDLALPPDTELMHDLCAPRYKLTAAGYQVESKDDIYKRIKRSPDRGDAVVYAHYIEQSVFAASIGGRSWRNN